MHIYMSCSAHTANRMKLCKQSESVRVLLVGMVVQPTVRNVSVYIRSAGKAATLAQRAEASRTK